MITKKVVVSNPKGVHLKVASELVKICKKHKADVTFSCADCPEASGCSIISILTLSAGKGSEIKVSADGVEAEKAVEAIVHYFNNGGGI